MSLIRPKTFPIIGNHICRLDYPASPAGQGEELHDGGDLLAPAQGQAVLRLLGLLWGLGALTEGVAVSYCKGPEPLRAQDITISLKTRAFFTYPKHTI